LWPLSRALYPKQFIRFIDGLDGSLLQATARRLRSEAGFERPMIVCNEAHRFLVRDELDDAGITPHAIILEPVARNTAPAIAVAALSLARTDRDAIMVVCPSDHVIRDEAAFAKAVAQAADIARTGKLVLFGVPPICAHTGYGYIQRGDAIEDAGGGAYAVAAFREKPDAATAKGYVSKGGYYWNSGIFVLHVASFLTELESLAPDVVAAVTPAVENARDDLGFLRLDETAFSASPAISIDYAVMEKTGEAVMLTLDAGWSDVGSWSALWDMAPRDAEGNAINGQTTAIMEDTTGCYIHSERALVSTLGVDNLIIVNTPDALLVADKDRAEDVSGLVAKLKQNNRTEHASHIREYRPWGYFEALSEGPRFQVKLLHVKPGGKLSHQMHHHRSEHWVVVKGTAKVTIGDEEKLVGENESVYIFATQWHRLENPGTVPLEIIEVQTGSYFGEDDIIRSDDVYNRAATE
jgi:mannose-1-phosphate guanylyltransferase/mannose-6-phosphate isomerase